MKILMVCLGNICRSPLAEGILKSKLSEDFTVESAGTLENMNPGKSPDSRSVEVAKDHGMDISSQRSQKLTAKYLEDYDMIFCMDKKNLEDVKSLASHEDQLQKISLLIEDGEVPDPFWSEMEDFDKVYQMLDKASEKIAEELKESVLKEPGKK